VDLEEWLVKHGYEARDWFESQDAGLKWRETVEDRSHDVGLQTDAA
jgi:hypothetical protein